MTTHKSAGFGKIKRNNINNDKIKEFILTKEHNTKNIVIIKNISQKKI